MNAATPHPASAHDRAEGTVEQIDRFWRRSGVPKRERESRLEELRAHFEDSIAAGQDPDAVAGPDVQAFAAAWIRPDRRMPGLQMLLGGASAFLTAVGLVSLLGPLWFGLEGFGIRAEYIALSGAITLVWLGAQVVRMYRNRIRPEKVVLALAVGVVFAGAVGGLAYGLRAHVLTFPWFVALAVLLAGIGCAALDRRLRATARTRAPARVHQPPA